MTGEIILNNLGFAFWHILGNVFLVICALLLLYAILLGIYTLIIKR